MDGFPKGFRVQPILSSAAMKVADFPYAEVARYFRDHPQTAKALLDESYDKRYSPSIFLTEESDGFAVGWFTRRAESQCVRQFSDLADAATDYLLFSLGKGRWTPGTTGSARPISENPTSTGKLSEEVSLRAGAARIDRRPPVV